jgi:hypothetical protein
VLTSGLLCVVATTDARNPVAQKTQTDLSFAKRQSKKIALAH